MQALTHASSEQTTLLVTHQLEGLADWDDVWVMQDGQIIEQGDYATLARAGGVFSALLAHRQERFKCAHFYPIWRSINAINGCCCLASCWPL
ncbi:transport ATP-binding protein CydD [Klebsiella pneumoniae subsp. ozaenae]|uniref:Transport ATP-binding protein CydD n=1 Tax=Klebsiella pneumoniae subsp. ozaenae TaxID=574 RepID=A0A377ZZF7_KLEPO|nr:transport ATP-binding protein CydD [Klebsiella pneumoniae subsp. ozaenae]